MDALSAPTAPVGQRPYWSALDGLRGVAVVAVILYHAFPRLVPNGFGGVDVFFVLSGYLITRLLLREREQAGRIVFGYFYLRRLLRLYPALLITVLMVSVMALQGGAPT